MSKTPGIDTLWAPDKVTPQTDDRPKETEVRYPGDKHMIVFTLQGKVSTDFEKEADARLDVMMNKLWAIPKFREQTSLLYIFPRPPLSPKVTFTFGALKLYVQASSLDGEVAQRQALDRLAMAIHSVSQIREAKEAMDQVRCELRSTR